MSYRILFTSFLVLVTLTGHAQPFVDLLNARYTVGFGTPKKQATPFSHLYIGSDIPLKLKENSFLILSPSFENWNIDSASNKDFLPKVSSLYLPVTAILPIGKSAWSLTLAAIPRFNGETLLMQNSFQMGGLAMAVYRPKKNLAYKLGLYLNDEFFGLFIVPLAGIDWRIDKRNYLFGVLPGRLTYEHQLNDHFYTGLTFRAITNSFRLKNGHYLRLDDNQLSLFLDAYITPHIVFSVEAGGGLYRKLRSGSARNKIYLTDYNWNDGLFVKLCTAYRIRL